MNAGTRSRVALPSSSRSTATGRPHAPDGFAGGPTSRLRRSRSSGRWRVGRWSGRLRGPVRTDVVRDVELDDPTLSAINGCGMSFASMAGLVYDEEARTLSFSSLARVWTRDEVWLNPFIGMAAVLQIGEARMLAPRLATQLGAEVSLSGHPDHGMRARPDETATSSSLSIIPTGSGPAVSGAEEFEKTIREYLAEPSRSRPPRRRRVHRGGPVRDTSSRCQVLPERVALYRDGLLIMQQLPRSADRAEGDPLGAHFQRHRAGARTSRLRLSGSYAWVDGSDLLHLVLPNALYRPDAARPRGILRSSVRSLPTILARAG